jgi:uncharacterized membrane protein
VLVQGVSPANDTNFTASVQNETADITQNAGIPDAKKEISVGNVEIVVDDKGLVHLKETVILTPTFDNNGIRGEFLIPKDAKDSLSIFYELGGSKLNFESKPIGDKELVTVFFPDSAKPGYLFNWNDVPGSDNVRLIDFMKNNLNINWAQNAKIKKIDNGKTITITEEQHLFSWNNIPGNDNNRLLGLLENDLKIEWVRNGEIKKSNDGKTITVAYGGNLITLRLDEENGRVTIGTNDANEMHSYEYILEKENGNLNVYKKGGNALRFDLKEEYGKASLEVLRFEYKEQGKNLTLETIVAGTYEYSLKKENDRLNIYELVKSQLVDINYNTYQFISTSGGIGTLNFSISTTPDVTTIYIKFPEESRLISQYIPDATISSGNELIIRPKTTVFNLAYRYYLPMPSTSENNISNDIEPPVVILKSPENDITAKPGNVTFKYSAEDASGIKNCELIINTETRGLNDNVTLKDNEFTINLGEGTYVWAVRCRDNSLNENPGSSESGTLIISQKIESDSLINFILKIFKSEYGISLLIAIVLIIYLTFAYFKRGKKQASSGGETDLEDLYPSEEKKSVEKEKKRKINQSIMKLMDENEQKVINILMNSGETTQANVYKITQIPKATLSNIMRKLEERNIIERRIEGKVKWVKLKDWVFE